MGDRQISSMLLPRMYVDLMKLTKTSVGKLELPQGKSDHTYYDSELRGFGLRLRSGGKRSWVAVYRIDRKVRRMVVGDASAVRPEDARKRAKEILARADLGEDSQAKKITERARLTFTLNGVIDNYLAQHVETALRPRPRAEKERYLRVTWRGLHDEPIDGIERHRIASELAEIAGKNGPVAANRARSALHALFIWAIRQGITSHNPVAETTKPGTERTRDRVLRDNELRAIWHACRDDDHGRIVRILMLTGQRREEVGGMMWPELDFDKAIWSLAGERTKNARPHHIPLSHQMLGLLREIGPRENRELLFGAGSGAFSGWSRCKRRLDQRCGVSNWRLHDLRRTAVTGMAELGIQPHVIEAVVNHVSWHKAGVAGIYNRAAYSADKRQALQIWTDHLTGVVKKDLEMALAKPSLRNSETVGSHEQQ